MVDSSMNVDLGEHMLQQSTNGAAKLNVIAPLEAPATATDDLKTAVEEVRSATILVELSLNSSEPVFHYISPVWEEVVGLDPINCLGVPISSLLFPSDAGLLPRLPSSLSQTILIQ